MSIQQIETLSDGTTSYSQRQRLEGQDWLLSFTFNSRRGRWSLSITDLDGVGVVTGQAIVCGLPLLNRAIGGPPGQFIALSTDGGYEAAGLRELGERIKLLYVSSDDTTLSA